VKIPKLIKIELTLIRRSEKAAYAFCEKLGRRIWIPFSHIYTENVDSWRQYETRFVNITKWIAKKKGII